MLPTSYIEREKVVTSGLVPEEVGSEKNQTKNGNSKQLEKFWNSVHETAHEVQSWPEWKRGGVSILIAEGGGKGKRASSKATTRSSPKSRSR